MKYLTFFLSLSLVVFWINTLSAQMIANISQNVQTEFATYSPSTVNFTPNIPTYIVEPDFSNISNFSKFSSFFNQTDSTLLINNHFTVKKSPYTQFFDIYNECTWGGTPIYITTDAVLHIYHVLYDNLLSEIELSQFVEDLDELTLNLIQKNKIIYQESTKDFTREAARRNLAFLYVAQKLLNYSEVSVPEYVSALVESELVLINEHESFFYSPIFENFSALDYSQFIPRGHYTKNDTLKNYFKAVLWYGWTIFTMEPDLFGPLSERHTFQALLLTQQVYAEQKNTELWNNIYIPTSFFVGKTDDPDICQYYDIALQVYGFNFLTLPADNLANTSLLNTFMEKAQSLPEPLIPNWIYGTFQTYKGFRFMGQRFITDAFMFAHLVLPEVPQRFLPKGLDIMAILGSDRAFAILDSVYKETTYTNYVAQIEKFQTEFRNKSDSEWAQNLYWNWLYCLMPLLYPKGIGYPYFMQTPAWSDKELLTALASWTELRHDAILYAKQSMSPCGIPPGPPPSYVEPNPHLYARLSALVKYTREGLENRNLLPLEYQEKFDLFEELLLFLKDVSVKELENIPLTDSQYENIFCFGKVMEKLVSETADPQNPFNKNTDDMAVIADVHTDSNTNVCLEEGVGYPLEIYVIVNEGGILRLTQGAIFSYYEFSQPLTNRLTDDQWREMLQNFTQPDLPEWLVSFMDVKEKNPQLITDSPENLFQKEFSDIPEKSRITPPETYILFQNYPNPFNPSTTIKFSISHSGFVTLKIFNILGENVETLFAGNLIPGIYQIIWNADKFSSGLYYYTLEAENFALTKKLLLIR